MKYFPLLIFLFLTIIFRFPSLFEPYWYGDEGVTLTVSQAISRGEILYRDIDDNKVPLLYFISAIWGGDLFSMKLLALLWSLVTVSVFYFFSRIFLGERFALLSTLIFIILTNTPVLEGNIVNGEIYFILLTTLSALLIWKYSSGKILSRLTNSTLLLAGIFSSLGFLFKVPAVADFGGMIVFLIFIAPNVISKDFFKTFSLLLIGFLAPLILTLLYFASNHAVSDFIQSAFLNNFVYAQTWGVKFITPKLYLYLKILILASATILFWAVRSGLEKDTLFISLWCFFALFGVLLSARPYYHYLLQIVPPFSLLLGKLAKKRGVFLFLPLVFILIALWYQFGGVNRGYYDYSYWYYKNFLNFLLGKKSFEWYQQTFDPKVLQTYALSDFLKKHTKPGERVFIWSDNALVYSLARRSPVGRFVTAYYTESLPYGKQETAQELSREKPRFILTTSPKREFPKLDEIISKEYNLREEIKGAKVYQRKEYFN